MTMPRIATALSLCALLACLPPAADDAGGTDAARDAGAGSDVIVVDAGDSADAAVDLFDATIDFDAARDETCSPDTWVAAVEGRIADEAGAGIIGAMAQLCVRTAGVNPQLICVRPEPTTTDGRFSIAVPQSSRCMTRATLRALLPDTDRAATYCDIDLTGIEGVLALEQALVLVETTRATTLPPLGDAAQARTVIFDDGLELDVVPETYRDIGPGYEALAARRIDPTAVPLCFVDDPADFEGLYAFSPEGDVAGPSYSLRLPNPTGIPAGQPVELYALGGLTCHLADGATVPEGQWALFGTGTVRGDGTVIEASGTEGLPCLNWLGYTRTP